MSRAFGELIRIFSGLSKPIQLHEPEFSGAEKEYVLDCLNTGWVSSVGAYVDQFEDDLKSYTDCHAVLTVNGTAALHLCLYLAGVQSGEEVLMPSLTFVATANAVRYCGAVPHFVDCEQNSFGVDADKLRTYLENNVFQLEKKGVRHAVTGKLIRVLIVTHIFGHPAQMDKLVALANDFNLILIEDAAEGMGSFYDGQHVGGFGVLSALSFNGNKILTTGGGGAVLCRDSELSRRAKHISTTAKIPDPYTYIHDELGFNYRMPNINAALGCAQLEQLPSRLVKKRRLASFYKDFFDQYEDVMFVNEPVKTRANYWLNTAILESEVIRNEAIDMLAGNQIFVRGVWKLMHQLKMFSEYPHMPDMSVSEDVSARSLNLPSSAFLADSLGI